jgi:YD repeat-containing protein
VQAQATLTWDGLAQPPVSIDTSGWSPGGVYSVALPAPHSGSGMHSWSVQVVLTFAGGATQTLTASGQSAVVDQSASPYGSGWGIGVSRLFASTAGVLWVTGQGDSRFFARNPDGSFASPPEDFGTLVQNPDGSYTYTARDRTKYNFNAQGLLTAVVDTHGLATTYGYDGQGRLIQVNAIDGGLTTLAYDPTSGLLATITEPGGRTVTLTHTGSDLTGITDPAGFSRTLGYDSAHHVVSDAWDPIQTTFSYDGQGLLRGVDQGLGSAWTITPAALGQPG